MTAQQTKTQQAHFRVKAIEIIKFDMKIPEKREKRIENFNFDVNLQLRVIPKEKSLIVMVSVKVTDKERIYELSDITTSFVYAIDNFDEVLPLQDNQYQVPPAIVEILNKESISATRGIMYQQFKGTFLHTAILPLLDLKKSKQK